MFIVHTMEEIQGLLDAHEQFKATLGEADKEYQSIVGLVQQVESIASQHSIPGGLDNPYTSLTAKVKRKKNHFYSRVFNSSAADRADNTGSEC